MHTKHSPDHGVHSNPVHFPRPIPPCMTHRWASGEPFGTAYREATGAIPGIVQVTKVQLNQLSMK